MSTFDSFEVEVDGEENALYKVNIGHQEKSRNRKILTGWTRYIDKIVLFVGIILISAIAFEAGFLSGQKNEKAPVVVNQPACTPCPENKCSDNTNANPEQNNQNKAENQTAAENQKCAFVASKNSNKYHLPTCQFAQKIKPENKVCFSSAEEAQKRGYQPAKCCIK